ncbi:MAG TPA: preprotein translocase subunit SecY [Verrucomicrobiae bacterium]|nr:preprotein translocase subunit SecY [Verrucomicrobiae bacterium]
MKSPLSSLTAFFRLPDLRRKFFIVIALIAATRFLSSIPIPGVDTSQLSQFLNSNSAFSLLNIFTGGGLTNFSITMLGVGPFITASIIFQLLTLVIPSLEALQKEGEYGRKKINQYTRLATIPLAFIQGFGTLTFLKNAGIIGDWTPWFLLFMLIIAAGGTLLLMWIGELISEQGLGNGMSMVITMGIISSFPAQINQAYQLYSGAGVDQLLQLAGFIALAALALIFIIVMNEGVRNIPVTYARRAQSAKAYGGVDTHLPIKVNATGVVPIIFAVSMVLFPTVIAKFLEQAQSERVQSIGLAITNFFNNQWYYAAVYFFLVIAFTYFYAFIIFQPKQMAENLQKQGGYIPGTRPGLDTENYLYTVIQRLTLAGSLFLAVIAVLPIVIQRATGVSTLSVGGTSLLIVVAVVLEVLRQVRAQVVTRTYDAYL